MIFKYLVFIALIAFDSCQAELVWSQLANVNAKNEKTIALGMYATHKVAPGQFQRFIRISAGIADEAIHRGKPKEAALIRTTVAVAQAIGKKGPSADSSGNLDICKGVAAASVIDPYTFKSLIAQLYLAVPIVAATGDLENAKAIDEAADAVFIIKAEIELKQGPALPDIETMGHVIGSLWPGVTGDVKDV